MITYNMTFDGKYFVTTLYSQGEVVLEQLDTDLDSALLYNKKLIDGGIRQEMFHD